MLRSCAAAITGAQSIHEADRETGPPRGVNAVRDQWDGASFEGAPELPGWRTHDAAGRRTTTERRAKAGRRTTVRPPQPRGLIAQAFGWLVALGLLLSVALVVPVETPRDLAATGGLLIAVSRVAAMAGTFLLLVTLLLIGRIPAIESALGQDRLVAWHRRLGPWVLGLITTHVVAVVLGYAQQARSGALHEIGALITTFPGMLMATAGFGLLLMAGFTSYSYVRRHMRYETWWAVHLYTYLAVALSFAHQIWTGAPFLGHPLARAWWIGVWLFTAGAVLGYRWGLPLVRSLRHDVTVAAVHREGPDVISVVLRGRHLDRLPVAGGQFLHWRFLRPGLWWQAHPYSLSALPTANHMRITLKRTGDHGDALARLAPGTRVAIEGPYGAFTHRARHTDRVLLVGAGVGVTPVRAMLDDLPRHVDVVAVLRASTPRDLVLRDEVAQLVSERGGVLHEVVGPRSRAPLDAPVLRRLVPDIAARDVYVCGPEGFTRAFMADARTLGVPQRHIHHELFSF
jgi:ferredoxin-NADP reductase/DMSO/TMAO reductase YedYZ heme-binding membrane subunit